MKKIMMKFLLLVGLLSIVAEARGVTTEDMEQARATTALWYLRYSNNGSGYLDDLNPRNLKELEEALKPKEKENIRTFKQLAAFPPGYQEWNKEQMVKYWSETFFASEAVPADAKRARPRVARKLQAMEISDVRSEPEPAPAADTLPGTMPGATPDNYAAPAPADTALAENAASDEEPKTEGASDSANWIYIMILVIAIIVVVALVVYAMNAMRSRSDAADDANEPENEQELDELRDRLARTVAEKNSEIAALRQRLDLAESRVRELEQRASAPSGRYREREISGRPEREVYLARANSRGVFVRADSAYSVGNSIFRLVTSDGITGTFSVIDDPSVFEVALMMPADYLLTACTGRNLQLSAGMRGIETDTPGTAVFEDGRWRVTRKATIRYTR